MRESDIEDYLVARVKMIGGEVRKVRWIGRNGAPDRLVMLPGFKLHHENESNAEVAAYLLKMQRTLAETLGLGRTIWVELKAPGEKVKPHQQREHDRMRRMGQVVVVVDSFEGVDEVLA